MNNQRNFECFTGILFNELKKNMRENVELSIENDELHNKIFRYEELLRNQELLIDQENNYQHARQDTRVDNIEEFKHRYDEDGQLAEERMYDEENNDTNNNPFSKETINHIVRYFKDFLESVYKYNGNEIPLEIEQNNKKAIFVKTMGIMSLLFSEDPDKNIRRFREKPRMHLKPHIEKLIGN